MAIENKNRETDVDTTDKASSTPDRSGTGSRNDGKEYGTAKKPAGGAHSDPDKRDNSPQRS